MANAYIFLNEDGQTLTFDPAVDTLSFDPSISAADIFFDSTGGLT